MDSTPKQSSQDDARLTRLTRECFELSDFTYDSPLDRHDLQMLEESCEVNRLIGLMHQVKLFDHEALMVHAAIES